MTISETMSHYSRIVSKRLGASFLVANAVMTSAKSRVRTDEASSGNMVDEDVCYPSYETC